MKEIEKSFVAFILTNGRPKKVKTYEALRRCGYTGKIILVVDDLDATKDEYIERYGDEVVIFDKRAIAKKFDTADIFSDMRSIVYARNACFEIAKKLGYKNFIELDDDYRWFRHRFDGDRSWCREKILNLDRTFEILTEFLDRSGITSVAMLQEGEFLGGPASSLGKKIKTRRKIMNSMICRTDRPFKFIGRINEDVNTYTRLGTLGHVFLSTNQVHICPSATQSSSGGMTELYLDSGTYVKTFYSVIFSPSSVKVSRFSGSNNMRLHHRIDWEKTVPMILNEKFKKAQRAN